MSALAVQEAYRRWAPHYDEETAISWLDDLVVAALTPPVAGLQLLDVGCGTARRLRETEAAHAVGVDICPEMLGKHAAELKDGIDLIVGDVRSLPLPSAAYDIIWCRLVLGHLAAIDGAYAELARVAAPNGLIIVTDFHPVAYAAGHRRTFRDTEGVHEIEHFVHQIADHDRFAGAAGLVPVARREGRIGPDVRPFYERSGKLGLYQKHIGLPVMFALSYERRSG